MRNEQIPMMSNPSLLNLYVKERNNLLTDLAQLQLDKASDKISRFIRELERSYQDASNLAQEYRRIAHYALNIAAESSETLKAVTASPNLTKLTETVKSNPDKSAKSLSQTVDSALRLANNLVDPMGNLQQMLSQKIKSAIGGVRLKAGFFLLGIVVLCLAGIAGIFYLPSALLPTIALVVIALVSTVGATVIFTSKSAKTLSLPELQPLLVVPSENEIEIEYSLDVNILDTKISRSLRIADELINLLIEPETVEEKNDDLTFDTYRMLELLQSLAAHRLVQTPDTSPQDLAAEAIRLLATKQITPKEFSPEQAHLFEEQPGGITEHRTLLPALVNEKGELVRQGIVLVPIK